MSLILATAILVAHLTFSRAQWESEGCSLSLEALLQNSTIRPDTIDRVQLCATVFSYQSNKTQSASVVAISSPVNVVASAGAASCAMVVACLELECDDNGDWIVTRENCSMCELDRPQFCGKGRGT